MRFTLDRYIAGKVIVPLAATFGIGLVFLLADRVIGLLDNTMGKGNMLGAVVQMLAYLSPYYIGLAIPIALFLGVLLGFSRMAQDNEIDALQAAGIGLHRLSLPILVLSILSLLASAVAVGWLQPHGRYAYRSVMFAIHNVEVFYLAEEGVFMQAGTRTFIFDELDRSSNGARRIFIYDDRGHKGGTTTIIAKEGQILDAGNQIRPTLRLKQGMVMKIKPSPGTSAGTAATPDISEFAEADTPVGRVNDKAFRDRGIDERELTLFELFARQSSPPSGSTANTMRAELHNRLVRMLTIPVLPFLAIPFALARSRSHRASNIGIAVVLLFVYNHFIEQGTIATTSNGTSPWLAIWLPFALMTLFTIWRFWMACFTAKRDRFQSAYDWTKIADMVRRWIGAPGRDATAS